MKDTIPKDYSRAYYSHSNEDTMRKQIIIALAIATILTLPAFVSVIASSNTDFNYVVNPLYVQVSPDQTSPNGFVPNCSTRNTAVPSHPLITCYSPNFVETAYNFTGSYNAGFNGAGQTIVIVDAFGSPTITNDLAVFDAKFNIPAPPSFTILCPSGGCPQVPISANFKHDVEGWAVETSLDVEWAHAVAPGANIVLAVAATSSGNAINDIESQAIAAYPGSVMSQSFGIPEPFVHANNAQIMQAHSNYQTAEATGITPIASSGDSGSTNGFSFTNAAYPSSDPLVLAVGGTEGNPYPGGLATFTGICPVSPPQPRPGYPTPCTPTGYGGEQVWNEPWINAAGGGAPSILFSGRTTPDVSYNAAVDGGVFVFTSFLGANVWFIVGGTSAGSPQWAGIIAIANQARASNSKGPLGYVNPILFGLTATQKLTDFHDITVGNNILSGATVTCCNAGSGYDDASGIGTPNVGNLVTDLMNA